jgi:COP9 signalosome complex subunit 5
MATQSLVDPTRDALFNYDSAEQKQISSVKPWKSDPHHFKYVRISAVALVKMVTHARSGGDLEVMGLMLGHVDHETFIITDAVRLPVEGTETRVNAQDEANEYIVKFLEMSRQNGQLENAVGWYHSHPGYGCWLSGIDVGTQHAQQQFTDPFVAVVIDPHRTISAEKVDIGAFRTYPEGYKPDTSDAIADSTGAVPMAKAQDFGAHADRYYPLEVLHFKSSLDSKLLEALGNKYWVQTLSSSPLDTNQDYVTKQIEDLAAKTKLVHEGTQRRTGIASNTGGRKGNGRDEHLSKLVRAAEKIANEEKTGILASVVKDRIFSADGSAVPVAEADTQMAEANPS